MGKDPLLSHLPPTLVARSLATKGCWRGIEAVHGTRGQPCCTPAAPLPMDWSAHGPHAHTHHTGQRAGLQGMALPQADPGYGLAGWGACTPPPLPWDPPGSPHTASQAGTPTGHTEGSPLLRLPSQPALKPHPPVQTQHWVTWGSDFSMLNILVYETHVTAHPPPE